MTYKVVGVVIMVLSFIFTFRYRGSYYFLAQKKVSKKNIVEITRSIVQTAVYHINKF